MDALLGNSVTRKLASARHWCEAATSACVECGRRERQGAAEAPSFDRPHHSYLQEDNCVVYGCGTGYICNTETFVCEAQVLSSMSHPSVALR